jgi:tetrahydromethanopterin S-methyltransferase subunit G
MDALPHHLQSLLDLEARHDELLQRLDELDKRVEGVLAQYGAAGHREGTAGRGSLPSVEAP